MRIDEICARLTKATVFADVGCDHGLCTRYMFDRSLCERAYLTDVSKKCLEKAEALMKEEIASGRCIPVVTDGLDGVGEECDLVLIAGMGGEEIVSILSRRPLPKRFVLQPMKNSEKVRRFLVGAGARIEEDVTFRDGKIFYDLLTGWDEGGDEYTDYEFRYGRDNLKSSPAAFFEKLCAEREKLRRRLFHGGQMKAENRELLLGKLYETEMILDAIEGDL